MAFDKDTEYEIFMNDSDTPIDLDDVLQESPDIKDLREQFSAEELNVFNSAIAKMHLFAQIGKKYIENFDATGVSVLFRNSKKYLVMIPPDLADFLIEQLPFLKEKDPEKRSDG